MLSAQNSGICKKGLLVPHAHGDIAVNMAYGSTPQDRGLTTGNCDDSSQNRNITHPLE
jgi:hypothetical protein